MLTEIDEQPFVPDGLSLRYAMDGQPPHQRGGLVDLSGNKISATIYGNSVYAFDGTADWLYREDYTPPTVLDAQASPFSLEMWVLVSGSGNLVYYSDGGGADTRRAFRLYTASRTPYFYHPLGSWLWINAIPANDTWAHLRLTFDGSAPQLYINGSTTPSARTSQTNDSSLTNAGFSLGARKAINTSDLVFNGRIGSVALYRGVTGGDLYNWPGQTPDGAVFFLRGGKLSDDVGGYALSIAGATLTVDANANLGQSWTRADGTSGDRFQGGGMEFDGVDDYIAGGGVPAVLKTSQFAIHIIVKTSSAQAENPILLLSSPTYEVYLSAGKLALWTTSNAVSTVACNDGNTHLISIVRNGDTQLGYVDGQPAFTKTDSVNLSTASVLYIGKMSAKFFQGTLYEIIVTSDISETGLRAICDQLLVRYK